MRRKVPAHRRRRRRPADRPRRHLIGRVAPLTALGLSFTAGLLGAVLPSTGAGPAVAVGGANADSALARSGQISPELLATFERASRQTGVPWSVLAGLAWQQTRDGAQAPGETGVRSAGTVPVALRTDLTGARRSISLSWSPPSTSTYPRLVPAITSPGWGIWLLTSPDALRTDPQDVPASVLAMARLMATDVRAGAAGLPAAALLGPRAGLGASTRGGWERVVDQLPIYRSGSGFAKAVLDQAAADQAPPAGFAYASGCPTEPGAIGAGVPGDVSILGGPEISQAQVLAWYDDQAEYPATINGTPAATLIGDYYRIGAAEGVRPDWAFTQAVLETGGFGSPDTAINNFAGIAHPDGAASGTSFPSVVAGVTAQIQLLKRAAEGNSVTLALAAAPGLPPWIGRPAATWADLTDNWASSQLYGVSLAALHDDLTGDGCPLPVEPTPATTPTTTAPPTTAAKAATTTTTAPKATTTTTTAKPTTPTSPPTTTAPTGLPAVIAFADAQVGKAYEAGATGPSSWGLPQLAQAAFAAGGFSVPDSDAGLASTGTAVDLSDLAPGDLLFTTAPLGSPTFVGIYVGDDQAVGSPGGQVIQTVSLSAWPSTELSARRVAGSAATSGVPGSASTTTTPGG